MYHLTTLLDALSWHPEFPRKKSHHIKIIAGSHDYVGTLPLEKMRLTVPCLETLEREQVLIRLLKLRPLFQGEDGSTHGIGYVLMGLYARGLYRFKDFVINDSLIQYVHALDFVWQNWECWAPHIANLAKIDPDGGTTEGWTRVGYARKFLTKEGGGHYSDAYLGLLIRAGMFLWENSTAFPLKRPKAAHVPGVFSGIRTQLIEYLKSYSRGLKSWKVRTVLYDLLAFRAKFLHSMREIGSDSPSMKVMVAAFFKARKERIEGTLETYAGQIDKVLGRWREWEKYFKEISQKSRKEGYKFAEINLRDSDQKAFEEPALKRLIRWGIWLWKNQAEFGLSDETFPEVRVPPKKSPRPRSV